MTTLGNLFPLERREVRFNLDKQTFQSCREMLAVLNSYGCVLKENCTLLFVLLPICEAGK